MAVIIVLLLISVAEVMACPGCTYERMLLNNWLPKMIALKVSAAVLITGWRLDPIRVLYTFVGYSFAYDFLYRYAIWFSFPGGNPFIVGPATAGLIVLAVGALDVGVLFLLSRLNFYRRKKELGLAWWHSAAYLVCIWTIWPVIT
ncbi:MAG: hypothetical protein H6827_10920 [Planctomycetes bacterium]|nr:hypothetical protein [Planctomycetota bacterium]